MSADRGSAPRRRKRGVRLRLRAWMAVNLVVLAVFVGWVYKSTDRHPTTPAATSAAAPGVLAAHGATKSSVPIPTVAQILSLPGKYYGITAVNVPWSASVEKTYATAGKVAPNLVEYYVNWSQSFAAAPVMDAYNEGALPVVTWEPFPGSKTRNATVDDPQYRLSTIIDGAHDAYIEKFAEAVKAAKVPIAIRFAHEMNGDWYPWSAGVNDNTAAQYVAAWRHVWNVFQQAGATNVIWIWAPNVLRGAQNIALSSLYPGDKYVTWIGMSAYRVTESTAAQVMDPTINKIRTFTDKNVLITETGAQPGAGKSSWTTNFLAWMNREPGVIGFVWSEYTKAQGGGADWGFDVDSETLSAFRTGIKKLPLAAVPPV